MIQQFINIGDEILYSVYHEPENVENFDSGIVLCYPYGQEYIRCHKLYVHLANQLAKRGFHVLRFDYIGTGDSSGEFSSLTVEKSLKNIKMVAEQFKESYELSRTILFGVRFGATLAFMCSKIYNIDALVLWDPVLDGNVYIKNINANYQKWLNGSFTKEIRKNDVGMENFGFQFSTSFVNEIKSIQISKEQLKGHLPILIFADEDLSGHTNANFIYEKSLNKEYWIKREDEFNKAMIPVYETVKTLDWLYNIVF